MPVLGGSGSTAVTDKGYWTVGTSYAPGDVVTFNGGKLMCTTAHAATPVFNPSKFVRVDGPSESLLAAETGMLVDNFADTSIWTTSAGQTAPTITAQTGDSLFPTFMRVVASASTSVQRPLLVNALHRFVSFKYRVTAGDGNVGLNLMVTQSLYTGKRFTQTVGYSAAIGKQGTAWRNCSVALSQLTAQSGAVDADLGDVRALSFSMTSLTGTPATFEFADLRLHDNPLPPGLLWAFDDARTTQYTQALPILSAAGMVGNIYVAPGVLGTTLSDGFPAMTLTQLQAVKAAGWSMGCHGYTHTNFNGMAQATRIGEFESAYSYLVANGLCNGGGSHIAYPFGGFDAQTLVDAQPYFRSGRVTTNDVGITPYVGDRMRLRTLYPGTVGQATSVWTNAMDRIIAVGGVLSMTFHEVGPDGGFAYNVSQATFQAITDYAAAHNLPSYTLDDLFPEQTPSPIVRSA